MNHRRLIIGAAIGVAAVALGWVLMSNLSRALQTPEPSPSPEVPAAQTTPAPSPPVPRIKAVLFFGSEDGSRLRGVEHEIPLAEDTVGQARAIVEAQLAAVAPEPLVSTIPDGAELRGLFVTERNEAFVDLGAAIRDNHPGGSMNELLTVYTIVNAVTTNLPEIQAVQLLIEGREVDTLAGHVDLRRPLRKNEALVITP